jgi:hypothetical protein
MRDKATSKRHTEAAQTLAIEALAWLAAEPERIGRFLAMTGIGPEDIRQAAREPQFLAGVLEHIISDERILLEFAVHTQVDPPTVERARAVLGGTTWERDIA